MLKKFIHYYKPYRKLFLIDFGCAVIVALLELAFPLIVNYIIDSILPHEDFPMIILLALGLLLLYLLTMGLNYIVVTLGHRLGINIETDMRRDLFQHIQKQSFSYFDNVKTGELMSRLSGDLFDISELAHHGPEEVFIAIMTLLGSFLLMYQMQPALAIVTVILVPLLAIALIFFNRRMSQINKNIYKGLANYSSGLENVLSGMRVVQAFANEEHENRLFEDLIQEYRSNKLDFYNTMGTSSSFNYVMMRLINLFTLVLGAYFTIKGQMTAGELVAYILLANVFVRPIERMNAMIELYPKGFAGFQRFLEIMRQESSIVDGADAVEAPNFQGNITYQDVSFGYEDGRPVLEHINLSIQAGQTVAFVGPSGVGKSTLVNLLPRFYEANVGAILIDGVDIRKYTLQSLRQEIGVVQQDVFLFNGTIRENVLYGRLDATDEEVDLAIERAKLNEVINDLPDGVDTYIGQRGVKLSGGQKQRLSIARIFLKNPSILILDEATSALDTQTERFIQQSLDDLAQGRTSLIIAHRLATIQHADRIIVVTENGILEDGSHQELMANQGLYYDLYQAQFNQKEMID